MFLFKVAGGFTLFRLGRAYLIVFGIYNDLFETEQRAYSMTNLTDEKIIQHQDYISTSKIRNVEVSSCSSVDFKDILR